MMRAINPAYAFSSAYIIAARRTAIGRIGGLHRNRRIEELCAPVVGVALQDSGLEPGQVDELIVGNASQGGNPARLIALAAGLPETVSGRDHRPPVRLRSRCHPVGHPRRGDGRGGGDRRGRRRGDLDGALAHRQAKSLYQLPRFMSFEPGAGEEREGPAA